MKEYDYISHVVYALRFLWSKKVEKTFLKEKMYLNKFVKHEIENGVAW